MSYKTFEIKNGRAIFKDPKSNANVIEAMKAEDKFREDEFNALELSQPSDMYLFLDSENYISDNEEYSILGDMSESFGTMWE